MEVTAVLTLQDWTGLHALTVWMSHPQWSFHIVIFYVYDSSAWSIDFKHLLQASEMDVSSRGLNRRSVLVLNSHSAVTTEPTHQNECRRWKTGISPFIDEEICWWGYWCCWLVQARTADSFGVGSSRMQITYPVLYIVGNVGLEGWWIFFCELID